MNFPLRRALGDAHFAQWSPPAQCAAALALVAVTTAVLGIVDSHRGLFQYVTVENPGTAYIVPVTLAAVAFGIGPALIAVVASFACIALFFPAQESVQELLVVGGVMLLVIALAGGQRRARVRAEELLRERERLLAEVAQGRERTRHILDAAAFGLGLYRADDLTVVDANATYAADLESYTGVPFTPNYPLVQHLPTFPETEAARLVRRVAAEGQVIRRQEFASATQPDRFYDWVLRPFSLEDGAAGVLLTIEEVTERVRGEREREQLRQQVEEQTAQLEASFAATVDGIAIYDAEGNTLRRNRANHEMLHLDPAREWDRFEIVAQRRMRYPDGNPIPPAEMHTSRALRGETVRGEVLLITDDDGNDYYLRQNAAPLRAADGTIIGAILVTNDVTAALQQEREREALMHLVEERRQFAQMIFDGVPVCLAVIDTATMQYQAVNPAYRAAMPEPYRGRDLFGLRVPEIFPTEASAAFIARLREVGERGIPSALYAAPFDDPAADTSYWDEMIVPLALGEPGSRFVLLQVVNVTERVVAQGRIAALAASEAARASEFAAVFASLSEGLLLTDTEGRILRYNRAAEAILALDDTPLTTVAEFRQRFETTTDVGEAVPEAQYVTLDTLRRTENAAWVRRYRNGRGAPGYMRFSASVIRDEGGDVTGSIVNFADITHEREARAERERLAREAAQRAAELEAIISSLPDGLCIGSADGQTWQFNPAARRIFGGDPVDGVPPAERVDHYAARHRDGTPVAPDELPAVRALRGETFSGVEHLLTTPAGEFLLSTSGAPICGAAGEIAGVVLIYADITARSRADREMTRLGRTLDASSNEIYVLNATNYGITQANERARQHLGYAVDALTARTFLDLAPGLDAETLGSLVAPLRDETEAEIVAEVQLRGADGKTYPAEVRFYLAREETPPLLVAIAQDISERHAALRQREEFFREIDERRRFAQAIVEKVPAGLAVFAADDTFRVRLTNAQYLQLFQEPWRSRGVEGLGVREYVMDMEETGMLDLYRQVRDTGEPITIAEFAYSGFERGTEYYDWSLVPLRETGNRVTGLLLLTTDATERVRTRQRVEELAYDAAQRASELEAVIASITDGVIVTDVRGAITLENAASRRFMGRTEAAVSFARAIPGVDGGTAAHGNRVAVAADEMALARGERGETTTNQVLSVRDPDTGDERFLLCSGAPIRSADGTVTGAVAVFRDITEIKQVEQMKDEFVSIAAHELRTPLTAIKGYADLLDRRLSHDGGRERDRQSLGVIRTQADRLAKLVNEMLDVSRIEGGRLQLNPEQFDLAALVEETVQNLRVTTEGHVLTLDAVAGVSVVADLSRIEQVLMNLVSNAITYSPQGDTVAVRVGTAGGMATVSVRDEGIGIAPDEQEQVFSRFYRTASAGALRGGGMGLGLYICREIVERHGGTIRVESTVGAGSTFTFTLPLAPAE